MGSDIRDYKMFDRYTTISIHAPRMGSDIEQWVGRAVGFISIHAPRMGSD